MSITVVYNNKSISKTYDEMVNNSSSCDSIVNIALNQNVVIEDDCIIIGEQIIADADVEVIHVKPGKKSTPSTTATKISANDDDIIDITNETVLKNKINKTTIKRKFSSCDDHHQKKRKFLRCKTFPNAKNDDQNDDDDDDDNLNLSMDILNMAFSDTSVLDTSSSSSSSSSSSNENLNPDDKTSEYSSITKRRQSSTSTSTSNQNINVKALMNDAMKRQHEEKRYLKQKSCTGNNDDDGDVKQKQQQQQQQLTVQTAITTTTTTTPQHSPLPSISADCSTPPQKPSVFAFKNNTSPLPTLNSSSSLLTIPNLIPQTSTSTLTAHHMVSMLKSELQKFESKSADSQVTTKQEGTVASNKSTLLSALNLIIRKYPRENPAIVVESGSIFNSRCQVIVNANGVDLNGQVFWNHGLAKKVIESTRCSSTGSNAVESLLRTFYLKNLTMNHSDKTLDIFTTRSGDLIHSNVQKIFHVHLFKYSYLSDFSEIHFKNTIQNILKLAIDNNVESIALPAIGCGELLYPSSLVVKWLDDVFKTFLVSYTCHSLKLIKVILFDQDETINQAFNNFYQQKDSTILRPLDSNLSDEYQITQVDPTSDEFRIVSSRFNETMSYANIKYIEKIHNVHLEHMYEQSKALMLKRVPANTPIEYNLFHGTSANSMQSICRFGFNRSYCGKNGVAFGQGVYFARDSKYSDNYSRVQSTAAAAAASSFPGLSLMQPPFIFNNNNFFPNQLLQPHIHHHHHSRHPHTSTNRHLTSTTQQPFSMILARVLVGCYHKGTPSTKEPELRSNTHQYDSTVDNIEKPSIFVIYRDYRAFPNYIIHYV